VSQLGGGLGVEMAAGSALALAGMGVAVLHVRLATEARAGAMRVRLLLGASGVSLFFAMTLAGLYAIRPLALPFPWLDLPAMRMAHGTLNALGFGLCGVLGWRGVRRE
jgi:diphthamide biosynthesis methyltransferase